MTRLHVTSLRFRQKLLGIGYRLIEREVTPIGRLQPLRQRSVEETAKLSRHEEGYSHVAAVTHITSADLQSLLRHSPIPNWPARAAKAPLLKLRTGIPRVRVAWPQ